MVNYINRFNLEVTILDNNPCKLLNTVILSMATKQNVLNSLSSEIFKVDIFNSYIKHLIEINLSLLESTDKMQNYLDNIEAYLKGKIDDPDDVIKL